MSSEHLAAGAAALLAACLTVGCGGEGSGATPASTEGGPGGAREGRWREVRDSSLADKIAELEAIGYAAGTNLAGDRTGVTVHLPDEACEGLNLYVSGHGPEALLMDMDGTVLHRWRCSFADTGADASAMERDLYRDFWRRAHLLENGDLLAIFEGHVLFKLDARSNLLWTFPKKPHHDLFVTEDDHIYVLTREAHVVERVNAEEPILEDFVSELDPKGEELRRVSILECFERSEYASFLERMPADGDILHTNTIELVDERLADRIPGVRPGHVLISCLFLDAIAIVDLDERRVIWAMRDTWRWQHQPTALDSGHLLLFDNLGAAQESGRSRVIELDPTSGEFVWVYEGSPELPLETRTCGSCQRLPNGNTLITETDNGRAIEVNAEKEIVWEFLSPHRAGARGRMVASLFEVVRLPAGFPVDWIDG